MDHQYLPVQSYHISAAMLFRDDNKLTTCQKTILHMLPLLHNFQLYTSFVLLLRCHQLYHVDGKVNFSSLFVQVNTTHVALQQN